MGSFKSSKDRRKSGDSSSRKDSSTRHHSKQYKQSSADSVPGVQKLKAALRQTKRLLAKDNLTPDVRVTTERRLKSLESDLARAERAKLERTMATRYHKVKFFERQKVLRKIHQTQRTLDSGVNAEGEKLKKKHRKTLEAELFERRVDLNYILHYPKLEKYISLFPPEVRGEARNQDEDSEAETHAGSEETTQKRAEIRNTIRTAMIAGELEAEPEKHLAERQTSTSLHQEKQKLEKISASEHSKKAVTSGVEEDAFFEME
ncbi:related to rRNA-processing protein EFG1-Coprinopsis cinerea [Serendipita indica DSM 11827]|uniref:rRNA-processing protein EFG1 n=1 Tax=Serendipita indica (strain DSM 11827) TaxID=1109443 RepID=G4TJN1_SERID|nr:related to rRNA-processing protein EFG1-Coprinopsis cinerea [Serendipita indica DSM 11827]